MAEVVSKFNETKIDFKEVQRIAKGQQEDEIVDFENKRMNEELEVKEEGKRGLGYDKKDHVGSGVYAGIERNEAQKKIDGEGLQDKVVDRKHEITMAFLAEKIRAEKKAKKEAKKAKKDSRRRDSPERRRDRSRYDRESCPSDYTRISKKY